MTTVRIDDIAYYLPSRVVRNAELQVEQPDWNIDRLSERTGVLSRHVAAPGETALDLALQACSQMFSDGNSLAAIDAILFCTQTPDYLMPPNSTLLHKILGLSEHVFALDFSLACSGYVYGLAVATGLAAAGLAEHILLVTADTYSKYINPLDRSARLLFGDAAAVTLLSASDSEGVVKVSCGTVGDGAESFIIPAGGCRLPSSEETRRPIRDIVGNVRSLENIHMDGQAILDFVKRTIPPHVAALLSQCNLTISDLQRVIFHQASAVALDWLDQALGVRADQSYRNLAHVGNTVSASLPIALKDAMDDGSVRHGDMVLLTGFGVGLSYASAVVTL